MNPKPSLALAALIATGLIAGTAAAQTTNSPNPNKAQNSNMRTQSGADAYAHPSGTYLYLDRDYMSPGTTTYYYYPGTAYAYPSDSPSKVWVVPAPGHGEPLAGTRNVYVPVPSNAAPGYTTNTPNPNKVQNNGVPTQYDTRYDTYNTYDTYYIYRIDRNAP